MYYVPGFLIYSCTIIFLKHVSSMTLACVKVIHLSIYLSICLYIHINTYIDTYIDTYMQACMHACMHTYMYMCIRTYVYVSVYIIDPDHPTPSRGSTIPATWGSFPSWRRQSLWITASPLRVTRSPTTSTFIWRPKRPHEHMVFWHHPCLHA